MEQTSKFLPEIEAIEKSIKNKTVFKGEVDGTLNVYFKPPTRKDFFPIHLNRSLSGLFTSNLKGGAEKYIFGFSISSFYKLLTEIEYIRMYSKFKNLKIERITLYISSLSNKKIISNLERIEYNTLFEQELKDIRRSHQLSRFFSGDVHAKDRIRYKKDEEIIDNEDDYSSIYSLLTELENIRNSSAIQNKPISDITIELTNLDDSRVFFRETVMERKDKMAQKEN